MIERQAVALEPEPKARVKRFMFVQRKPPHGTIYALEGLEVVLVAGAFDQEVSLAFIDDGVYQLVKGQDTSGIGLKNFSRAYRALKDYDVHELYVEEQSLTARGLHADDLLVEVQVLQAQRLGELMEQQDIVLSF